MQTDTGKFIPNKEEKKREKKSGKRKLRKDGIERKRGEYGKAKKKTEKNVMNCGSLVGSYC